MLTVSFDTTAEDIVINLGWFSSKIFKSNSNLETIYIYILHIYIML